MNQTTKTTLVWGMIGILVLALVGAGFVWNSHRRQQNIMAFQNAAKMMGLSQVQKAAPEIHLTDQNGKQVALSDFRSKIVVLTFIDPASTDLGPVVAKELLAANKTLAGRARNVVFLAVDVNPKQESVADVKDFSQTQGLNSLSNWYFLTGTTDELKKVWQNYNIFVTPNSNGSVQHTSIMYFIDRNGQEQAMAQPTGQNPDIAKWGTGIALVTEQLV